MSTRFFFNTLFFIIIGIFIGIYFSFALYIALFIALVSIVIFFKSRRLAVCTLLMAIIMLITANTYGGKREYYKNITITATVETVEIEDDRAIILLKDCKNKSLGKSKVLCYVKLDDEICEGNQIIVSGNASPVKDVNVNYGDFYISPLAEGVTYRFYAENYQVTDKNRSLAFYMRGFKAEVRRVIFDNVENEDSAAILYAMVSGDKSYISTEIKEIFSACGTSHLLAVSGLHVTIFLSLFIFILKKLKIRNAVSLLFIGGLVFIYSAFTGFSSSVLRASVMAVAINTSVLWGEKYNPVNSLGLAGSVILLSEPYRVLDIGFQLSFLACLGICWIMWLRAKKRNKIWNAIQNSAIISLGATLFVLPLQIYYFGTVSLISVIANVLEVAVVSINLTFTFVFVLLALLWSKLGFLLSLSGFVMTAVIKITEFLSHTPAFSIKPIPAAIAVVVTILMIFFTRFVRLKHKRFVLGALVTLLPIMWISLCVYNANSATVHVPVFEKSACVHVSDDKNYVIGLCDEEDIEYQINYINRCIGEVDGLILTDYEDMTLLETAIEKGLQFKKLYSAVYMKANDVAQAKDMDIVATLKTENGYFDFSQQPLFYCGEECIEINKMLKNKEYSRIDIRSH